MTHRAGVSCMTWAGLSVVAALVMVASGCRRVPKLPPGGGDPVPGAATLIADPPRVESATLQLLEGSPDTARLRVRYAPGRPLPARIPLELEGGTVWLVAEGAPGDGAPGEAFYAAEVPLDVEALAAYQAQIDAAQEAAHGTLTVPIFDGRVAGHPVPLPSLNLAALTGGKIVKVSGNWVLASAIDATRSLLITDAGVTGDVTRTFNGCNAAGGGVGAGLGKWSFGYLMQQAAGTQDPSTFVRNWLKHWESDQVVNGFTARKRSRIKNAIIDPWEQASGGAGKPLDLAKAPFRLLAIVNRVDFAEAVVYGAGRGGELRFVFGAVAQPAAGASGGKCNAMRFTVIFEYDIGQTTCPALRQWARQWVDLAAQTPGTPAYNDLLAGITDKITQANAAPAKPNGSALNQIRTNEIALPDLASTDQDKAFWDMREFQIDKAGGLGQVTVAQTPALSLNRTATLADYVNTNAATIKLDRHVVPLQFPTGAPFRGANALMQPTDGGVIGTFWTAKIPPITDPEARFHFSFNTCSGCHAGETGTNSMHISPLAKPPPLSGFLTGISVADPDSGSPTRAFGDLERRRKELARIANNPCVLQIFHPTLPMVH
ncbi:MAG: hypothetical protein ACRERC_23845 [Candidatus Binatia bacterium]